MSDLFEYELGKASGVLIAELFKLREGESLVITCDTESDMRVVDATARTAFAAGGKPMVVRTAAPLGVARETDGFLPVGPLRGALTSADCWVEFNKQYLLYSETWQRVTSENPRLRYLCLPAMNVDVFVRLFARVDPRMLADFLTAVATRIGGARHVRLVTAAGTDVGFQNAPTHPVLPRTGYADRPGTHMLAGMIAWAPEFESIDGVLVFDGSIVPQIGILSHPLTVRLRRGEIQSLEGGREAEAWGSWLRSFDDPQMLRVAHVSCGFHPGAKLTGQIGEDERIWGGCQWGFGAVASYLTPPRGTPAASHTDAISLRCSIWLDGRQITDLGKVVDPDLASLAGALKRGERR
jgi:leucyl aminopeptidase (aminopeptidase T)